VTTESASLSSGRRGPSPVLVLAGLGVLTFALIPVQINTIYSGLPAHPLFLHVPVILIPVATIAAAMLALRPRLFARHGVWITAVAVVALGTTNLTMSAGKALRKDLGLGGHGGFGGGAANLVARHAHAADILRLLMILFTGLLVVALAVYRGETGVSALDGRLARFRSLAPATLAMRVGLVALALGPCTSSSAPEIWAPRPRGRDASTAAAPGSDFPAAVAGAAGSAGCSRAAAEGRPQSP
jgi:hypothetical protein